MPPHLLLPRLNPDHVAATLAAGIQGYSINVPLKENTSDETFHALFKPIMRKVMEVFAPSCIVLQCGADSLAHDRLGCFNLSLKGHSDAVRFMKEFGVPMLVTGGECELPHYQQCNHPLSLVPSLTCVDQ
jgi:acetoin utilization deacetylase AcuC-like enzyme